MFFSLFFTDSFDDSFFFCVFPPSLFFELLNSFTNVSCVSTKPSKTPSSGEKGNTKNTQLKREKLVRGSESDLESFSEEPAALSLQVGSAVS
jgi:hypothetical protein